MKGLLRNGGVQAFLGWLLGTYLKLILRTVRWRHENLSLVEPVLAGASGALGLFWHGRIPLCLATAPQWWRMRTSTLISPSADGEFVATALAMSGFPAIRMSSAKKGDGAKARAAVAAFRQAVSWVAEGGALIVTPDGPRGPGEVIAAGALQIARRSGAPIFLMGIAASPAIQLDTWDQVMIALPFGRGTVVWDGPFFVPADADDAAISVLIADWSQRLSAATRRAEALTRGEAPAPEPARATA
ncbi:MAG: lysophospholipid acyltransferase family protein [Caulobacterales bacterium]